MSISVQEKDFDVASEYAALSESNEQDGAVVFFVGKVRNHNQNKMVTGLSLEHYPGMTEKSLADIVNQAHQRWELGRVRVIHRYGDLGLGEQIVFVGTTSKHRQSAFESAAFIMDYLKTRAPFWKKETTVTGSHWVVARESDELEAQKWNNTEDKHETN